MSQEQNIAAQQRFGTEVAAGGQLDVIDELTTPDFLDHDPAPDQGPGPAGFKAFWGAFRTAFPDLQVSVDQMVADEDNVAIAYRAAGTHQGDFLGVAGTGKPFEARGVQITKFVNGKMAERWGSSDVLGIMQQVGAIAPPK
jgi:steroid delta-isomerase-like uncharacterized protein